VQSESKKTRKPIEIEGVCLIRYVPNFDRWELDAGLKFGGKSKYRKQFKSLNEAKVHAEQLKARLKNEGLGGFKLSRSQQVDAEKALKILDSKATLVEACKYFMSYNSLPDSKRTISSLVIEFLNYKEKQKMLGEKGASDRTIKDYKHRLGLLSEQFGSISINEFDEGTFLDWIILRGDARGLTRTTKALFSYAVNENYIPEHPIKRRTPVPKIGKPSVLEDSHWRSLILTALETQNHRNSKRGEPIDLLACVILGLWCGLRPEAELKRLDWSDVNIDEGFVNIHDDWKVKIGRHVTIPECAKNLLHKCTRKKGAIINPRNFRKRWDWLRQTADVMNSWDSDIMRHTFASMHYGLNGDKQKIINELGHCNDSMLRHYINHGAKMKSRANEFFSFTAPLPNSESELTEQIA
jgi:integrase